jgi:16S rRNA (cytosine967-C5)-methyltransferase
VLRRQIYLDRVISTWAGSKKLDTAVRIALRMGAYQLLFLDKVPAYSAINESVNLVQRAKKTSAKGMVNAVLRRISESPPIPLEYQDDIERISVETSHPRWLIEKWIEDFGADEAAKIAIANNQPPPATFRRTINSVSANDLVGFRKGQFAESVYIAEEIDSSLLARAESGEIYFQDEASQLVAEIAGAGASGRFLDVCAAPGGKTTLVAMRRGGEVVAGDLHRSRVAQLIATCSKQGAENVRIVQYDAERSLPFAEGSFGSVLVDAPCSGTGTIRHNPEIRYTLEASDLADLSRKQRTILQNASKVVIPGGSLVYSTCSIQREENEAVCESFLQSADEFEKITPDAPERLVTQDGFIRTFSHRDGVDGFFIAVFRRRHRS